ncbi:MAG: hypothetical protein K9G64_04810 [Bacteroidia bacterium]|nr:hypothetical protein [Bacteroidia bacterium]
MINLNKQFLNYESKISLQSSKSNNLIEKHNILREKISTYFKNKTGYRAPDFYIQGSYKMNLMIQKKDGTYDVDLGVFFKDKPIQNCTEVQSFVLDAVKNHTNSGASQLKKCIRVNYAGDFNIDLPIYYQTQNDNSSKLAIKNEDWRFDDPEEMVKWFDKKRTEKEISKNGQLIRIIKYLKRWVNELGYKTPSGIALTVWASENFIPKLDRDDICLYETMNAIKNSFWLQVSCNCPVQPYDNLVSNLDDSQKTKFKESLKAFCNDLYKAIYNTTSETDSVNLVRNHLGDKFTI